MNINDIEHIAKLIELYGVGIVVIAFGMVVFIGILLFFMKTTSSLMKNVMQLQKDNQNTMSEFGEKQEHAIKNLGESMVSLWELQGKIFDNIDNKIKEIEDTIKTDKKWDIKNYKAQIEKIMLLTIADIELYIINKIHTNGLYKYKTVIKNEIEIVISEMVDKGREKIVEIPYSTKFDIELFKGTELMKKDAVKKIIKLLDVEENYKSIDLFRSITVIAGDMRVKISSLLNKLCRNEKGYIEE